jgi:hypothetical protein
LIAGREISPFSGCVTPIEMTVLRLTLLLFTDKTLRKNRYVLLSGNGKNVTGDHMEKVSNAEAPVR